jgi:Ca2+-binding EF-hand superfamily protein
MRTSISEVKEYFQRHRINELLCDLTEELALKQPDQPIEMLHRRLSNLIEKETVADVDSVPAASSDRAFAYLQMHVESSGRGGSCVRHFSKRAMKTSDETLESWKQDATATLTEAFNCMTGTKGGVEDSDTMHTVLLAIVTDPEGFFQLGAAENLGDLTFDEFTRACEASVPGISRDAVQRSFRHLDADKSDKISLTELAQTTSLARLFFQESKCEYIVLAALIGLVHEIRSKRESGRTPKDASVSVDRYREQPILDFAELSEDLVRGALAGKMSKALANHGQEVKESLERKIKKVKEEEDKGVGKFATASYGKVSAYDEGLDAIGTPHPKILEHMQKETTGSKDSNEVFEAWNSGSNKTTPQKEWDFVYEPFKPESVTKEKPPREWVPKHTYGGNRFPIRLQVFLHALLATSNGIRFGNYKHAYKLDVKDVQWLHQDEVSMVKVVILRFVKAQLDGVSLINALSKHGIRATLTAEKANIKADRIVGALDKALHETDGSDSNCTYEILVGKLKGIASEKEIEAILDHFHKKFAEVNVSEAEVIGLRQYSGPLYVKINGSLRLVGAHIKMVVSLPCALELCTQDVQQTFKEAVVAVAQVNAENISLEFVSELQFSQTKSTHQGKKIYDKVTRIEVRVGAPAQKEKAEEICMRLTERGIKTELASKTVPAAQELSQSMSVVEAAAVVALCEHLKGNRYVNTIYAVASGMRKISRVSRIPRGRRVYRGMGGVKLPIEFLTEKEGGGRGGVDYGACVLACWC